MLDEAIGMELKVAYLYMWQHVKLTGIHGLAVKGEFKKIAIDEMKHAEAIAERLDYLGGELPTTVQGFKIGKNLKEMAEIDIKEEVKTIELYKRIIEEANKENDPTTARLFRKILEEEEEHHDFFTSLLEES